MPLDDVRPQIERLVRMIRAYYGSRVGQFDPLTGATTAQRVLPLDPENLADLEAIEKVLKEGA